MCIHGSSYATMFIEFIHIPKLRPTIVFGNCSSTSTHIYLHSSKLYPCVHLHWTTFTHPNYILLSIYIHNPKPKSSPRTFQPRTLNPKTILELLNTTNFHEILKANSHSPQITLQNVSKVLSCYDLMRILAREQATESRFLGPSLALGQDAVDCLLTYKALLCTYSKGTKSMTHIVQGQA